MQIALAPMEGLIDHPMREIFTAIGGYDYAVTEFVRVVNKPLPAKVFFRMCPELTQSGKTLAGTPVHVQLLGNHCAALAENAKIAADLGAPAIDLNFGCPAKTVNNSKGGAVLLKETATLAKIVEAVRKAVPDHIPVSAKMRLGFDDANVAMENAKTIESAGASWLTVHARTKTQGYKPPAYWHLLQPIAESLGIPVIANGEIWTRDNFLQCKAESQCRHFMIGRGAIRRPDLARQIKDPNHVPLNWIEILQMVIHYFDELLAITLEKNAISRVKQWLNYLTDTHPEAQVIFESMKRERDAHKIHRALTEASS